MTTAGSSVTVTPGSGATMATHAVGGKEHSVVVLAGANGTLERTESAYRLTTPRAVQIFNPSGSGVKVVIKSIGWTLAVGDTGSANTLEQACWRVASEASSPFSPETLTGDGAAGVAATEFESSGFPVGEIIIARDSQSSATLGATLNFLRYGSTSDVSATVRQLVYKRQLFVADTNASAYAIMSSHGVGCFSHLGGIQDIVVPENEGVFVEGTGDASFLNIITFTVE
jgi:hypothetical protein